MSKAVKCPVCEGLGKLHAEHDTTSSSMVPCHGCGGKGWVEVTEAKLEFTPFEPDALTVNITFSPGGELPPEIGQKILEILRKEIGKGEIRQKR